ncbi:MAG: MlaD family protein [Cyclobacteriaceae bacterium]
MKTKASENVKLGLFVLAGLLFLILTLYMIGKNRNLFGATFTIKASMSSVNGLMPGNNVRFKGIDVGTVKGIELAEDGTILVEMIIDKKMTRYIKQNAIASIATDGIMGNKLVNIDSQPEPAPPVGQGSVILSREPIETDEMLRTLNTTNNTIERVTRNLDEITIKLNTSNSLWNLLSDTVITHDLKDGVMDFRSAAANTAMLTGNAKEIVQRFGNGDGLAGTLFTDTTLTQRLDHSLKQIEMATDRTALMMEKLELVVDDMKAGEGTAGLLLSDTVLRNKLMQSALHIEEGTSRFNDNMEALKSNFFFRKYFKKLEKQQEKEQKKNPNPKKEHEAITKENKAEE